MFDDLPDLIAYCFKAHRDHAREPHKAVRYWDGKTPYGIHPIWCAMTLLTETSLPQDLRQAGAAALLFHDLLEDTTAPLPEGTPERVRSLVQEMTFVSSTEEMIQIWRRTPECQLLKLYDKVSNLLDATWMDQEKRSWYVLYTQQLAEVVERNFGPQLNILKIARAICA